MRVQVEQSRVESASEFARTQLKQKSCHQHPVPEPRAPPSPQPPSWRERKREQTNEVKKLSSNDRLNPTAVASECQWPASQQASLPLQQQRALAVTEIPIPIPIPSPSQTLTAIATTTSTATSTNGKLRGEIWTTIAL